MDSLVSDFKVCDSLIRSTLSAEQQQVLDGPPAWDLRPPQREEHDTPADYVRALGRYADRVLYRWNY